MIDVCVYVIIPAVFLLLHHTNEITRFCRSCVDVFRRKRAGNESPQPEGICRPFSRREDKKLLRTVQKRWTISWKSIAKKFSGRTAEQCRDRYYALDHQENPDLYLETTERITKQKQPWTKEEDKLLVWCVSNYGTKWGTIQQKYFQKRSRGSVSYR